MFFGFGYFRHPLTLRRGSAGLGMSKQTRLPARSGLGEVVWEGKGLLEQLDPAKPDTPAFGDLSAKSGVGFYALLPLPVGTDPDPSMELFDDRGRQFTQTADPEHPDPDGPWILYLSQKGRRWAAS